MGSIKDITDRIISDAEADAGKTVAAAEETAAGMTEAARRRCEEEAGKARAESVAKMKGYTDGIAASARLDGAKIMLAAKRGVIDDIYASALKRLRGMTASEYKEISRRLLEKYAEDGDEIVFAEDFPCAEDVASLPIVKERHLRVSFGDASVRGGFVLRGSSTDKDTSFGALLGDDRAENEARIAKELFRE